MCPHFQGNPGLKVAITELTGETIAARDSSDKASARIWWLNVL
jgi:hypothetical protein